MNRTTGNGRIARKLTLVAATLGLWGALVALFAAPLALTRPFSLAEALTFAVSCWAPWLLFLPVVVWLSFRFPIERVQLARNVAVHLLACVLLLGISRAGFRVVEDFLTRAQHSENFTATPDAKNPKVGPPGAFSIVLNLRTTFDVLFYCSLVGACQAIRNFRRSQERERRAAELEARLSQAQLQALRMQLNPHFLFNTLNSIAALVHVNPRAADEMLADLSELLRRSLDSMEDQEVSLAHELDFLDTYFRIEQRRFGERLQVELHVPHELRAALVPALILQPLVENAIRHGIEPRRGPGLISLEAKQQGDHLHLLIRDNGRGLAQSAAVHPCGRGIGLANTRARLQALYGEDQCFTVTEAEPAGCQVEIRLPLQLPEAIAANQPAA